MTHSEQTLSARETDHVAAALDLARRLAETAPTAPVPVDWMQAAQHVGDFSVLTLARS